MKFCPNCGTLMIPKKKENKSLYECNCGYSETGGDTKLSSNTKKTIIEDVVVPTKEAEETLPTCKMICDKCGNTICYYWELQTRASDEPPTRFFKCTKCKNTWRDNG